MKYEMNEERTWKVTCARNGREVPFGYANYFTTTLEKLKTTMEGQILNHPEIRVYTKYGTKPVMVFQG